MFVTCICGQTTLFTLHWNEATPPNITVSFCGCGPISLGLCFILPVKENRNRPADNGPYTVKLKRPLKKKTKIGFQDRLSHNAGQKYCRMLQGEHSSILSTFIKLPFVIKIFVLSIFEWLLRQVLLYITS